MINLYKECCDKIKLDSSIVIDKECRLSMMQIGDYYYIRKKGKLEYYGFVQEVPFRDIERGLQNKQIIDKVKELHGIDIIL